jgi:hypothetical protein
MYRSTSPDGPFEKVNKVDMDWFLSHSLSNILLEPSTTYYYKLELVHDTNGFLMQVGDVISVTTDSAEYTPVLTEDDKLSAIEVATREAGGESYYSFIGSLDTISNIDVYLGRNPQNYSINFAVLIENEPEINCDLYYNIFSLDGQFIGRVDSRKFEVNSGEGEATYPMIFGDKYFKVGSFLDITEPIVYQVTISQYME